MKAAMIHEQIKAIVGDPLNYVEGGIYQIILIDTDRCYLGRSVCVGGRLFDHVKALLLNKHINVKLQRAWNKYGPERFSFKVLQQVNGPAMAAAEQHWIDHHQAASVGFNIVSRADPFAALDPKDPNVIQYRRAMELIGTALGVAECARLRSKKRATLQDCLRFNAFALGVLKGIPEQMVRDRITLRMTRR
jgi:hypothetical protein